jgi:hypothetical protein
MCKDPVAEPIIVTPCGHVFDWICIEKCIMTREEEALVCPYCTNVIIGFSRDIDDEASLSDYLEQLDFTAASKGCGNVRSWSSGEWQ